MGASLEQIEVMVDALEPADRARLLEYLIPKIGQDLSVTPGLSRGDGAWQEFRDVGQRLAVASNGESITQSLCNMRR